jgi:beta-lactam-binding protein with PASTA domain
MATPAPPPPPPDPTIADRRARELFPWLVATLFAVLAILGFAWALAEHGKTDTKRVPRVVGMTRASASARLREHGFGVVVNREASPEPAGRVLRQAPAPNVALEKDADVNLLVSAGPPSAVVPNLITVKSSAAARLLSTAKLKGQPRVVPSEKPKNTVVDQNPGPGSKVSPGTIVFYSVSKGPQLVVVPSVRGLAVGKASQTLRAAGLVPVPRQVSSPEKVGTVVAQSPVAGTKARPGSNVRINVATGASTPAVTVTAPTVTTTAPATTTTP